MPFVWIQRALFEVIRPSSRGYSAYLALSYFAVEGRCRAHGVKDMARLVDVSEDTIKRGLAELVERGAIVKMKKFKKVGTSRQQLPNEYVLIDLGTASRDPI